MDTVSNMLPGFKVLTIPRTNLVLCIGLLLIALASLGEAQFFTKTSKSIPRMGRRSDATFVSEDNLLSKLLEKYGENEVINESIAATSDRRQVEPVTDEATLRDARFLAPFLSESEDENLDTKTASRLRAALTSYAKRRRSGA